MSASKRLVTLLLLAIQLAGASAPCPTPQQPDRDADLAALAGHSAAPCPAHGDDSPSTWLDALCPCGCQSGAPPGHDGSRTVPALLLAEIARVHPAARPLRVAPPPQRARFAPAPPDHVPLAIA